MSSQSKYGAVEVAEAAEVTPRRARGVVLALALCAGGALFAVAGPNTAGGTSSQSATSKGGEHVYKGPGGAPSRGTTGAGQGSVPAGMGVSD